MAVGKRRELECRTLLVLSLLSLFVYFSPSEGYNSACPAFDCNGNAFRGRFMDRSNPYNEATDGNSGVLAWYFFNAEDFGDYFPEITDGYLGDTSRACAEACQKRWNANAQGTGERIAGYWMFEQTCNDGPGGQCLCMADDTCEYGNIWSDDWVVDWEYGDYFAVPTNYTTGKVCKADVQGDPHFTGADGSHFEFSGIPNRTFAIMSDAHLQVNAYLGGRYGKWNHHIKAMTWIRQVAIMWGHHMAILSARSGPSSDYETGYLQSIEVNGEPLEVHPHGSASAVDGELTVAWTEAKKRSGRDWVDVFHVSVKDTITLRLTLRPEVKALRTPSDGVVHFAVDVERAELSSNVHGILGQTFRPDFVGRLSQQSLVYNPTLRQWVVPGDDAEGFIDGGVDDYLVKGLLKADCNFCRFMRGDSVDEETASAMALAAGVSGVEFYASRKLLQSQ